MFVHNQHFAALVFFPFASGRKWNAYATLIDFQSKGIQANMHHCLILGQLSFTVSYDTRFCAGICEGNS